MGYVVGDNSRLNELNLMELVLLFPQIGPTKNLQGSFLGPDQGDPSEFPPTAHSPDCLGLPRAGGLHEGYDGEPRHLLDHP